MARQDTPAVGQANGTTPARREIPAPRVGGVPSVAGRGIGGAPLHLARIAGSNADVLLPASGGDASATFTRYLDMLTRSGVFASQSAELAKIKSLGVSNGASDDDGRPRVAIVLSEAKMMLPGAHANTENLIALVEKMGCRPVLVPPCADLVVNGGPDARARAITSLVSTLDGLVGPGGADVDPRIYGEANTASVNTNYTRDLFEASFVKAALDGELFAFGICRSHQLWNAAAGGSLIQDLQQEGVSKASHVQTKNGQPYSEPMVIKYLDGRVQFADIMRTEKGSRLAELIGDEPLPVNSLHHQAVDEAGNGFRVAGRVKQDTGKLTIEATERWNGITVQFHPELMQNDEKQRTLLGTLGRRAHAFELLKDLRKQGPVTLPVLLQAMRADSRYDATDIEWAKRDLAKKLG